MNTFNFPPCIAPLGFYAVVPSVEWVARCVDAGADTIQLRNKDLQGEDLRAAIQACVDLTRNSDSQFFVNDYWQLAIECGAYGVHLGQEDMVAADLAVIASAGLRLGISTHSSEEMALALKIRPSYVACGPIYATTTKEMAASPRGLERLRAYVEQAGDTPTVAIGGIDLARTPDVLSTGVSSIAVVRGVTEAEDHHAAISAFKALFPHS
ncbi:MAG: thiamine phosphate synthase [Neisseriaceae bacterium]|nr:thiamine phosphate synthase [Neisseriaceae bacterium]